MTSQDARERAWQEVAPKYSHMLPNALVSMFREFFDKTWDAAKREDEQRIAAVVEAVDEERVKFQNETLRTSELTALLLRFEKLHEDRGHEPGAWSRTCIDCELVAEARALMAKPINVRALAGQTEESK